MSTQGKNLFESKKLLSAISDIVALVDTQSQTLTPHPPTDPENWKEISNKVEVLRGRPLFFESLVGSGLGRGPLVETIDGAVRYDLISGIGVHFFGHSDPDLLRTAVMAALQDIVQQGNLHLNTEYGDLLDELLKNTPKQITLGWLSTSGAYANENALKICRAKQHPAHMVVAFNHVFAGRTTTMAEITDNPSYRTGQTLRGEVLYIPFYDPSDPESTEKSAAALENHLESHSNKICAMIFELVQGEGGFNTAPPTFFERLMQICHDHNVLVWVDEVQTFGRTTQLFATQALGLNDHVDIITTGKLLQTAATLYKEELNPPAGLLSGTFAGSTVDLAVGRRIIERLTTENYFGPNGRNAEIERLVIQEMADLASGPCRGMIDAFGATGTMVWFTPLGGKKDLVIKLVHCAYEHGLISFFTGHGPYKIRMLLPGGILQNDEIRDIFKRWAGAIQSLHKTLNATDASESN